MAKIRVAQIKDLSLTNVNGVETIEIGKTTTGAANTIVPLTTVAAAEADTTATSVITRLTHSGNTITPKTTSFADIVSGGLVLTPATAGTGVITSLTKSDNTLTAVYTNNSSNLTAASLTVMGGYTQDAYGKITATTKSFNAAQFAETGDVISLHQDVLNASTYLGKDAIAITTIGEGTDAGKKQVALTIDAADQVLTQSATGLKANVTLAYGDVTEGERTYKAIQLVGKNGTISTIDATAFIKDGMLSEATIVRGSIAEDGTFTPAENGAHYIKLVWNTDAGKQDMYVPAETLVDSYTNGNEWITIDQSANTISHATIGDAGTYAAGDNVVVNSTTSQTFTVPTFTVDAAGHVTAGGEKTVTITLPASIDTALQGVSATGDDYITATFAEKDGENKQALTVGANIGRFSNEEGGAADGLATTTAVESYVQDYVANNAATTMYREVIAVASNAATLRYVPTGDVAITQNGIDLNPGEYTLLEAKKVIFTIDSEVGVETDDVFVAYYMYNPTTQPQA